MINVLRLKYWQVFIGLIAFPIGIWFVQPRLNLVNKVNEMLESEELA